MIFIPISFVSEAKIETLIVLLRKIFFSFFFAREYLEPKIIKSKQIRSVLKKVSNENYFTINVIENYDDEALYLSSFYS